MESTVVVVQVKGRKGERFIPQHEYDALVNSGSAVTLAYLNSSCRGKGRCKVTLRKLTKIGEVKIY